MRSIAALLVFLTHVIPTTGVFADAGDSAVYSTIFARTGFASVSFFFILSGFVLTWAARRSDSLTLFWRRRLFKIFPNHLVVLLAGLPLVTLVSHQSVDPVDFVLSLFLLQTWTGTMDSFVVNLVAWSLSCELLFYLAFPFLKRLVDRIRPARLWAWAGAVTAASFAAASAAVVLLPDAPRIPDPAVTVNELWFLVMFPPLRVLDFVLGMLLARLVLAGRGPRIGLGGALATALAAFVAAPLLPPALQLTAVPLLPLGLIVAAGAALDVRGRRHWLSSRAAVRLGEVSFAFYVCHYLVLDYGHQWLAGGRRLSTPLALGLIVVLLLLALVPAWLLFRYVETPVMRRFGSSNRRRARTAEADARTATRTATAPDADADAHTGAKAKADASAGAPLPR